MTIYGDTQMWTPQAINGVSIADEINDELHIQGTQITLERANKDRINGWARVHSYLDTRRPQPEGGTGPWLRAVRSQPETALGCPMLIQTIGAQTHDDKMTGDMKKGANDHWVESVRYLLMSEDPLTPVPVVALTEVERRKKHFTRRMETAWAEHAEHLAAEHPAPDYPVPVAGDDYGATLGGGLASVADLFE